MNKTAALAIACTLLFVACGQKNEPQKETFTDPRDKKIYKTVKIGEQVWMAENLNYEAENSICFGENGGDVYGYGLVYFLSDKKVKAKCDKYGRLYKLETAMKACPDGWHLPSGEEWVKLYRYVKKDSSAKPPMYNYDYDGIYASKIASKHLKSKSGWTNALILYNIYIPLVLLGSGFRDLGDYLKSGNGEDTFGFTALPGGYACVNYNGSAYEFYDAGGGAYWWGNNYYYSIYTTGENYANDNNNDTTSLFSIRCLQNTPTPPKGTAK